MKLYLEFLFVIFLAFSGLALMILLGLITLPLIVEISERCVDWLREKLFGEEE